MTQKPLKIEYSSRFKKDLKRIKKSNKKIQKLLDVVEILINRESLPDKYGPHPLVGTFKGWWDCHIEPDWLLIYRITEDTLELSRMGSHSDIFV
jgi:mRNA interferase YafQ